MRPELVIFDCDGVLVDSEIIANQALMKNLARYGLDVDIDECMQLFVGGTMATVMTRARQLGADLPDGWVDEMYGEAFAKLRQGVPLIAGIPELLDRLDRAGIAFCVASNGGVDKMQITLGQNGLWDRFQDRMFSAQIEGTAKPDPRLFEIAAAHFKTSPQSCVVIEDSCNGVTAAARAGMRCLGYAAHGGGEELMALGAEVFRDMAKVPAMLGI